MRAAFRLGAVTAAAALLAAGCTSADPPRPATSPGAIPNERVSTDDALPAEFPGEFPLPPHRVIYSAVSPVGVVAYFTSDRPKDSLKDYFLTELSRRKWTLHSCLRNTSGVEPVTTIVASRSSVVATAVVGYSPDFATRLNGRIYSFFVSVARDADPPLTKAKPC